MTYTLCLADVPLFSDHNPITVHNAALANGLATRAFGCLFMLHPGVSIKKTCRY